MIHPRILALALALGGLLGAPALAQAPPPPPYGGMERYGRMFGSVSPEGREILTQAMREQANKEERLKLKTTRDRIGTILEAEKLDSAALKRAMDEERALVNAQHARRQTAMLAAFQKLTPADRKAFVADARRGRDRVERRAREPRGE